MFIKFGQHRASLSADPRFTYRPHGRLPHGARSIPNTLAGDVENINTILGSGHAGSRVSCHGHGALWPA
jgi:hypothetical protein